MGGKKGKRGFFFTIMALAILSFMLLTVQVWVQMFELSDSRASQRFKGDSMRLVLTSLSDQSLSEFANASGFYAMYRLSNYSSTYGIAPAASTDGRNPGTGNVEEYAKGLMLNGQASSELVPALTYSDEEKSAYTVSSWQAKIREAAGLTGFNVSFSNISDFSIRQADEWAVNVRFSMQMNVSDREGTMHQSKILHANTNFSIAGFQDPAVTRSEKARKCGGSDCPVAEKQLFMHPSYREADDVAPIKVAEGVEGAGWFFGPVTEDYPEDMPDFEWGRLITYVLVHDWDENLSTYADVYGAFVVTTRPVEAITRNITIGSCTVREISQTRCINCLIRYAFEGDCIGNYGYEDHFDPSTIIDKPFLVVDGVDWLRGIPPVNKQGVLGPAGSQQSILFDNQHDSYVDKLDGYHSIYDITKVRDMAICGFYVQGPGPSFFQRMLADAYSGGRSNSDLGLESFLIGKWAGGADDRDYDQFSRLDHEFYLSHAVPPASRQVQKVKGMMGCKDAEMCDFSSTNATTEAVGKFRLSQGALERFGLEDIACGQGSLHSSCDIT